jgi:integrase/recombinase XerD
MDSEAFRLWDDQGSRLYLTADERAAFRAAARAHDDRSARTFCHLLLFSGCRISEGLEITSERFDWQDQAVMFRTLKKRGRKALTTYRAVPLPADFLDELDLIHHLRGRGKSDPKARLWAWSRPTAWRRVKAVMDAAGIEGTHASPKGLRHGFGVVHALNKTPLPTLQRWMGHSDPKTTAIYMQAVGEEARQLAGAAW